MAMSPRKRARISRGVQYAVLVVIVAALALTADWGSLGSVFLDPDVLASMWPEIITTALKNTLLYTICAFTFGLVLGLLLALMRLSPVGSSAASRPSWSSSPSASACRSPSRVARCPAASSGR